MAGDAGWGGIGSEGDGAGGNRFRWGNFLKSSILMFLESFCLLTNSLLILIVANFVIGTLFNQSLS